MQEELELQRAEIFRGRQHRLVFLAIKENALLVSEIMRIVNSSLSLHDTGTPLSIRETSRALKWLTAKGFAVCLNPSHKHGVKGILYKLTDQGRKVRDFATKY